MSASILVVDDSMAGREKIADVLQGAQVCGSIYQARNGVEGLEVLAARAVDLVVCDLAMPEMDGFGFLRSVRGWEECQDLPVVVLSWYDDLQAKVTGFELGASDFLVKPFADQELVARVRGQLRTKNLQDQLKRSNRLLQDLSSTDSLTGLRNRRCFMETLQREIQRSRFSGAPLSLLMTDLDRFKAINDLHGHPAGDEVLVAVAALFRSILREYDLAARYGGEEFAIVLPETDFANAVRIADRLRSEVETLDLTGIGICGRITMSLGVASFEIGRCHSAEQLIGAADAAMYQAKRAGRNRVEPLNKHDLRSFGEPWDAGPGSLPKLQ